MHRRDAILRLARQWTPQRARSGVLLVTSARVLLVRMCYVCDVQCDCSNQPWCGGHEFGEMCCAGAYHLCGLPACKVAGAGGACLDECSNDTERRESQILERASLAHRVQERVQIKRDVRCSKLRLTLEQSPPSPKRRLAVGCYGSESTGEQHGASAQLRNTVQEQSARVGVRRHALQQRQSVAHAVRCVGAQCRRRQQRIPETAHRRRL